MDSHEETLSRSWILGLSELGRPRYHGLRSMARQFRGLPRRHGAKAARSKHRPYRQLQGLRTVELSLGHENRASKKPPVRPRVSAPSEADQMALRDGHAPQGDSRSLRAYAGDGFSCCLRNRMDRRRRGQESAQASMEEKGLIVRPGVRLRGSRPTASTSALGFRLARATR